jgi:hypothetical protein
MLLLVYRVRMERGVCSDSCCQRPDAAHQCRQAGQRHQQGEFQLTQIECGTVLWNINFLFRLLIR